MSFRPPIALLGLLLGSLAAPGCSDLAIVGNCQSPTVRCGGACVDPNTDSQNCGACGMACPSSFVCNAAKCTLACQNGLVDCSGTCVSTQSDRSNCGACGKACAPGEVCSNGACSLSCQMGLTNCTGNCVNVKVDRTNCGGCGVACKPGEVCSDGKCALSCQMGLTDCGGQCVNLQADNTNCGACGTVCMPGEACVAGACGLTCQMGLTNCNGQCVNLQNDTANCGACGTTCKPGEVCSMGACLLSCQNGLTDCKGTCRDLQNDVANCGACGAACKPGELCVMGKCGASCGAPLVVCSGACVDPRFDPANCGACGKTCMFPNAVPTCTGGQCGIQGCVPGFGDCNKLIPDGCEAPLTTLANCGGCGIPCATPNAVPTCAKGACAVDTCNPNFADCNKNVPDGCEVNTRTDAANCGACGKACAMGQACCNGVCKDPVAYNSDAANCGACGSACAVGGSCCGGLCYPMGQTPDCADCTKNCNGQTIAGPDFGKGTPTRLGVDPMGGLVTVPGGGLNGVVTPYVWVVMHDSNLANRVDAQSGKVIATYGTRGGNPSRTTVALDDTLWIAHRCPNTPNDPNCSNVVQLNPDGTPGCIISKAADGQPMPFNRAIAIDGYGYIWDGTWNDHRIHKIDPLTCRTVVDIDLTKNGQTSYPYGFAIDARGKMWISTLDAGNWMSVDTNTNQIVDIVTKTYNSYGVVVDRSNNAYFAEWCRNGINRIDGNNLTTSRLDLGTWFNGNFCARGMAVDSNGDIWAAIASWNSGPSATFGFKIQGGTLNRIGHWQFGTVTSGVGIAADAYGRIWQSGQGNNTFARMNKDTGVTDLSGALVGTNAYNYSDWTGYALRSIVTKNGQFGNWLYVFDSGTANSVWQRATWTQTLPPGTSARVRFRAAASLNGLLGAAWCDPFSAQPVDLKTCGFGPQRYLQAQVFLTTKDDIVVAQLNNLKVFWQ